MPKMDITSLTPQSCKSSKMLRLECSFTKVQTPLYRYLIFQDPSFNGRWLQWQRGDIATASWRWLNSVAMPGEFVDANDSLAGWLVVLKYNMMTLNQHWLDSTSWFNFKFYRLWEAPVTSIDFDVCVFCLRNLFGSPLKGAYILNPFQKGRGRSGGWMWGRKGHISIQT